MPLVPDTLPLELLYFVAAAVLVGALSYAVIRWWLSNDEGKSPEQQPEESYGYPLASWRYVYDLDKAGTKREMESVHEQAETLSEADQKRR